MGKTPSRRHDFEQKLLAYSATAGAALAMTQQADGNIIWSGLTNITVHTGNPSVSIDLDGGGQADFSIAHTFSGSAGWWYSFFADRLRLNPASGNAGASSALIRRFNAGQVIGPGASWTTNQGYLASHRMTITRFTFPVTYHITWSPNTSMIGSFPTTGTNTYVTSGGNFRGQRGYIGVRFEIAGGSTHYGWIDFEADASASLGTIRGWAYESTADTGLPAGAIPEPGSLALLAMGAAGLYAWRKGRGKNQRLG